MKKKILAAIVCASLMLTTACGNPGESERSYISSTERSSKVVSDSKPEESSDNESSAPESQTPSEPENSTPEANGKFVHGKFDGNVYTSEFLGFKAEIDSNWTIYTDDMLAQTNGVDDMSDEKLNEALDVNGMAYEMMALSGEIANVNITVQNVDVTNGGTTLTADEYVDLMLTIIGDQFKALGLNLIGAEKATVNFLGKDTVCLSTKVSNQGIEMVQNAFMISKGKYLATITFTAADDAGLTALVNTFKAL